MAEGDAAEKSSLSAQTQGIGRGDHTAEIQIAATATLSTDGASGADGLASRVSVTLGGLTVHSVDRDGSVGSRSVATETKRPDWEWVSQIPNVLTALRILLIPVMVVAMEKGAISFALFLFMFAAFTDLVDGQIARHFKMVSDFGKLLDPLADKILVMAALVMMVSLRSSDFGEPWVPAWMVVLVLAREFWVTGIRAVAAARGLVVAAGTGGKWKSALQMLAVVLLFMHDRAFFTPVMGRQVSCQLVGLNLLLLSLILSYWSAAEYSLEIFRGSSLDSNSTEVGED